MVSRGSGGSSGSGVSGVRQRTAVVAGRLVRRLMLLRGGGSALPGRVALGLAPQFLSDALGGIRRGLVFVSGSNGKSTTTNMLVAVLRAHGLTVFTNPSGGNLPQGIASALLASVPGDGLVRADIGVLEVDEAYGVNLARVLHPRATLLINVQIDQLNRFFEPTRVAGMLHQIADSTSETLIVNADDEHLAALGVAFVGTRRVIAFGVDSSLLAAAPHGLANARDFAGGLAAGGLGLAGSATAEWGAGESGAGSGSETAPGSSAGVAGGASAGSGARSNRAVPREVELVGLDGLNATLRLASPNGQDVELSVSLPARGLHYALDTAAAVATARALLGAGFDAAKVREGLSTMRTVYGRGEVIEHGGEPIELIMMKNPPSLQLNLDALDEAPEQLFVAVDEGTPDPSWFYDTDLSNLDHVDVITGTKAWQFATRFAYAGLPVGAVEPELASALQRFLALPRPNRGAKTMIVNYEQMMLIRKRLGYLDLEGATP